MLIKKNNLLYWFSLSLKFEGRFFNIKWKYREAGKDEEIAAGKQRWAVDTVDISNTLPIVVKLTFFFLNFAPMFLFIPLKCWLQWVRKFKPAMLNLVK